MNLLFIPLMMSFFANSLKEYLNQDTVLTSYTSHIESSFNSIFIYNDINVYITEGEENAIIVKNEEAANQIKYIVNDGVLVIKCRGGIFRNKKPDKIIIIAKKVIEISLMGDSEVRTIGELSNINLKLYIYGDGSIFASTKANQVSTLIHGLGKIEVKGEFKNISVNKDTWGNTVTSYN